MEPPVTRADTEIATISRSVAAIHEPADRLARQVGQLQASLRIAYDDAGLPQRIRDADPTSAMLSGLLLSMVALLTKAIDSDLYNDLSYVLEHVEAAAEALNGVTVRTDEERAADAQRTAADWSRIALADEARDWAVPV